MKGNKIGIQKSNKPSFGCILPNGINDTLNKACKKMGMGRSEFVRYCLMKTLQELSLISEQVKDVKQTINKKEVEQ